MIERQSVVDQIEITRNGDVQVRLALQLVDGDVVHSFKWHRTVVKAGTSAQLQMDAVNDHLVLIDEAQVSQADIDRVKAFCDLSATYAPAAD